MEQKHTHAHGLKYHQKHFQQIENSEIKTSKTTTAHFKIFGQRRIKTFEVTYLTKFGEVKTVGKNQKNPDTFLIMDQP
jgi:hypothetical protein